MKLERLKQLNNFITNDLRRKVLLIQENQPTSEEILNSERNGVILEGDTDDWSISEELETYIQELAKSEDSIEEKIIKAYVKICYDYTYDDNVLTYLRQFDDDTFFLPDEYGRKVDSKWKENRKGHNRRTCYEVSRILAKSIQKILENSDNPSEYDVCVLWDKIKTHYYVGLTSKNLCATLDLDDFNQIKDLTRVKTGLTIDGIKIYNDSTGEFTTALKKFNDKRVKYSEEHIDSKFRKKKGIKEQEPLSYEVEFFKTVIQILKDEYKLDPAGVFEYMKEIVNIRLAPYRSTKHGEEFSKRKVWKEINVQKGEGAVFTRCLIVNINGISYIMDVTEDDPEKVFREPLEGEYRVFNPKENARNWEDDCSYGR